ncbi:MAG: ATP phosphoribosyltransferase regulatory subunit, partial [Mangrovibacterium sp.]
NNRKILSGVAETIGEAGRITDITVAIDKLDKIGSQAVNLELLDKGISPAAVEKLQPILRLSGTNTDKLSQLEAVIGNSDSGMKGTGEMRTLLHYLENIALDTELELDLTLARGLNYYTGAIFEVKAKDVPIGSISGGGRYDDLTGIFGMPGLSGVGISFGADRIYDVMMQLELFPQETVSSTRVLFVNFGVREESWCLPVLRKLRCAGIPAEIYPEAAKIKKQLSWAHNRNIPFVVMAGETEMAAGKLNLKNMHSGKQQLLGAEELLRLLSR